MADRAVRLEQERTRINDLWQVLQEAHAPLHLAAAFVFHKIHENTSGIAPFSGYNGDLNIVAAALSSVIPVYTLLDHREGLVPLPIDLTRQRFAKGATELRCSDGFFFADLKTLRADVAPAAAFIKRAGMSLTLEFYPVVGDRR